MGVLYVIENIYMYIFGSEAATWEEIKVIYSVQTIKLLNYLDKDVPSQLMMDARENSSNKIVGFELIPLLLFFILNTIIFTKKRLRLK